MHNAILAKQVSLTIALLVLWSWALLSSTQIIVSIPEGEQKDLKFTYFARSALCTGNYDLYLLDRAG